MPGAHERQIAADPVPASLRWRLDPDLIEQVLVNLLINGCEASPRDATVRIHAEVIDGRLDLTVSDHGCGVAPPNRDRLFRPFFTTKPQGHGLGLAVSRNIVREHGGQVEALPVPDGGTVFRVQLPPEGSTCASPS